MFRSTDDAHSSPAVGIRSAVGDSVSAFLAELLKHHLNELVVVHTGQGIYIGVLRSVSTSSVTLDADSEALDQRVVTRIDPSRIEAVEVLPD